MRRNILKQNKRIRLRKKKMIMKAVLFFGSVLFSLIFTIWGAYNEKVRIVNIYIKGNRVVLDQQIKDTVKIQIKEKYFRLFPKDNIFIYPKGKIKQEILSTFKRIYYVKISAVDLTSLVVAVKEREPYALWCEKKLYQERKNIMNACYFIDDKGFIFTKAPIFSDNVYFTVYGEIAGEDTAEPLGKNFLSENRFVRLVQLRAFLKKEGVDTKRFEKKENGDFEFYLSSGGRLIFNESQNIGKLLRNLVAAIEVKESEGQNIEDGLEYIDVRFSNKVLFKFKK